MVTQKQVTDFYDRLVFPSKTSHKAYSELVPNDLNGLKVGDFGCGQSLFLETLRKAESDAVFLDISNNALKTIDYGKKINASLTSIPLVNESMDLIYCIGVVHHIPEMDKSISELLRVLKVGGRLFLGVYADTSIQAILRRLYDKTNNNIVKKVIYCLSGILIFAKNYRNNLRYGSEEFYKRIDDLLKTPLVRYDPIEFYLELLGKYKIQINEVRRISCMNIIIVEKFGYSTV
jgi:ubiquinone/menaquinone biosynthesis C-methylase UbiE